MTDEIQVPKSLVPLEERYNLKTIEELKQKISDAHEKKEEEDSKIKLRECFYEIKEIFLYYLDISEENAIILTLWTMGAVLHFNFESFPILYLGGMRGSGKSRTLKLISAICNGKHILSPTEAVLFRTYGQLSLDEMEAISGRDRSAVKEFLNGCYKKGMKVIRMKKVKGLEEKQVPEEFEVYRPVAIGNIYGLENVLSDRCISIFMEKSGDPTKIRILEDFSTNLTIQEVQKKLFSVVSVSVVLLKHQHTTSAWNSYIYRSILYTNYTNYTNNTNNTNTTLDILELNKQIKEDNFFLKIYNSGVTARELELYFPLFILANIIDEKILDTLLKSTQHKMEEKKKDDESENLDIQLYDFVSRFSDGNWLQVKKLFDDFRNFTEIDTSHQKDNWFNIYWFGKALKRLSLVLNKRRMPEGIQVMLDIKKAREKLLIFKHDTDDKK